MRKVKKEIEVKLYGLNELGIKEINNHYKHNISMGYFKEFQVGDLSGLKKKRFKQVKSFENLGLENYITTIDRSQLILNEDGKRRNIPGPKFTTQLKHHNYEVFEIEIIETFTKKEELN
jgi:hypothetical protein